VFRFVYFIAPLLLGGLVFGVSEVACRFRPAESRTS
jgi:uncharacterized membrane protein YbhN (UPF0104 family)